MDKFDKVIVVRRTVTVTSRIPFGSDFYPDSPAPLNAVHYEQELELQDKISNLVESLEFTEDPDFSETVTVDDANESDWKAYNVSGFEIEQG